MKYIFNYNNVFYSFFYDGSSACTARIVRLNTR